MREIKFRAWDKNAKSMVYDGVSIRMSDGVPWENYEPAEWLTLMQYTGLKDKNGKEIYEGDILDYIDEGQITEDFTEPVRWDKEQGYWCTESSQHVWKEVAEQAFVIGNIYENPELLTNR